MWTDGAELLSGDEPHLLDAVLRLRLRVVCEVAALSITRCSLCHLGVAAHRLPALAAAFSTRPDGVGLAFADLLAQATNAFAWDGDRAAIGTFDGDLKVKQGFSTVIESTAVELGDRPLLVLRARQ